MRSMNTRRPSRMNSFEFRGSEEDPLRRDLYQGSRMGGHSPEVSNIVADHGVLREVMGEFEGPMPDGSAGYEGVLKRGPVMSPAAPRLGEVMREPDPTGLRKISTQGEAQINQNNFAAAMDAGAATQQARRSAGVGRTYEKQDQHNDLRAALEERREVRGQQSQERALDRSSMETIAGLENQQNQGAPQTVDLGDGRKIAYYNGQMLMVDDKGNKLGTATLQKDGSYLLIDNEGNPTVSWPRSNNVDPAIAFMAGQLAKELAGEELNDMERRQKEVQYEELTGKPWPSGRNAAQDGKGGGQGQQIPTLTPEQARNAPRDPEATRSPEQPMGGYKSWMPSNASKAENKENSPRPGERRNHTKLGLIELRGDGNWYPVSQ